MIAALGNRQECRDSKTTQTKAITIMITPLSKDSKVGKRNATTVGLSDVIKASNSAPLMADRLLTVRMIVPTKPMSGKMSQPPIPLGPSGEPDCGEVAGEFASNI